MLLACSRLCASLVDFAEGTLAEAHRERVERHVSRCPRCADTVIALREIPAELRRRGDGGARERFWRKQREAILRAVEDRAAVIPPVRRLRPSPRPHRRQIVPALAVAALLAGVIVTWWRPQKPDVPASPSTPALPDGVVNDRGEDVSPILSEDFQSNDDLTLLGSTDSVDDPDESLI